ncbi:integrase [Mycobacteroides abscessus subsp. abscessus]|nr:integrase [Mycobacteroides abscessus subsp. abscessus]
MTVGTILRAAVAVGIVDSVSLLVPRAAWHKSVTDPDGKRPHILTGAEIQAVAKAVPDRLKFAVLVAAVCGLRLGEIWELNRNDPDPDADKIYVRCAVPSIIGEGLVEHGLKSKPGRRRIAVPPSVHAVAVAHFNRHAAQGAQRGLALPRPGSNG